MHHRAIGEAAYRVSPIKGMEKPMNMFSFLTSALRISPWFVVTVLALLVAYRAVNRRDRR